MEDLEMQQNFISVNGLIARDSYGNYFKIGEEVGHDGAEEGDTAIIEKFEVIPNDEIKVYTTKGHCRLDFLIKLNTHGLE